MGVIERAYCKTCGMSWSYKTGCGINHGHLDNVLDLFDEPTNKKVRQWSMEKEVPLFQFDYHGGICDKCKAVVAVPQLKLFPDNMIYRGKCEKCGSIVSVPEDICLAECPQCGAATLEKRKEGMWD